MPYAVWGAAHKSASLVLVRDRGSKTKSL